MLTRMEAFLAQRDSVKHTAPSCWYDRELLWIIFGLLVVGLVAVTSASEPIATRLTGNPLHFTIRHGVYVCLALIVGTVTLLIPLERWLKASFPLLMFALASLFAVLIVGRSVNGASRWISLGIINFQPAELAKLALLVFLAGYLVRRHEAVRQNFANGFAKPFAVLAAMAALLMAQPDFGSFVVMLVITTGMIFMAGSILWQFILLLVLACGALTIMILSATYRVKRMVAFLDPWSDPFNTGYQLTQSLMAFGRGDWFGQGLGNSIQKLEYLPEAHTDFVFSVWAEEMGLVGVTLVLLLIFALVFKALMIAKRCLETEELFGGYLAVGLSFWFAFQSLVNVGAAAGLLPTKGLTLPLISYGGSSLLIMAVAVALLMRIDHEQRLKAAWLATHELSEDGEE
uniref:cell division protein FtsW n=1 Tax=Thaumasiovibrio occultus TaxID=1891184 RepID=UPI000B34D44F|nr:cell division protein FtsW [Thaumasiovibrio occultus]